MAMNRRPQFLNNIREPSDSSSSNPSSIHRLVLERSQNLQNYGTSEWYLEYESDTEANEWNDLCFDDSIASPIFQPFSAPFGFERSVALEIGQELIDRHVGQQTSKESGMTFSPDRYYQLIEDDENKPLNASPSSSDDEPKKTIEIGDCNEMLLKLLKPVYDDICDDDNKSIIYQKLSSNNDFNRYLQYSKELNNVTFDNSSIEDRLTFFINIYNIMLIHITLKHGPPQGIWQRKNLVNKTYYTISGHKYALHSIINGILRANRKGPGMLWKAFGKVDRRLPLSLPNCDPLIHFSLCTGSKTTPPLRLYHTKTIYSDLRQNAKSTLLNGDKFLRIDTKKNAIHLGKTFKWYIDDFGGTTEKILQWILDVLDDDESDKKMNLQKLFFTGEYSVEYIPFDWSTNGKELKIEKVQTESEDTNSNNNKEMNLTETSDATST